jgi:hypothetical protein
MEVSGQHHAPATLLPGEQPPIPTGYERQSGRGGEEKKSLHCLFRELNLGRPARSLVTILTELSRRFMTNSFLKRKKKVKCTELCKAITRMNEMQVRKY